MSTFMQEPVRIFETMEDVREAMALRPNTGLYGLDASQRYRVKSLWLISLIEEILATSDRDFAYNAEVKKLAADRLGIPPQSDAWYASEGDTLSLLVYNAQCFRRSDRLRAEGFEPFTRELVKRAFQEKRQIKLDSGIILKVRQVNGELYAMQPRKRSQYLLPGGQPAMLVTA